MDQSAGPLEIINPEKAPGLELRGKEIPPDVKIPKVPLAADLSIEADALGEQMRQLIVSIKRLPRSAGLDPHQDPVRALSLAQAHLQTGFMWLRRAIETPKVF